jgi:hypothetical protein
MSWLVILHVVVCITIGVIFALVGFRLNVLHDRAIGLLKDKSPPSKKMHMVIFLFAFMLLSACLFVLLLLGKRLDGQLQGLGLVVFLIVWWGLQITISIRFKRSLENVEKQENVRGRNL